MVPGPLDAPISDVLHLASMPYMCYVKWGPDTNMIKSMINKILLLSFVCKILINAM